MTDAPPPPASVAPPTDPPIPSPRRWDWRPKLRWFGAEYLIVVLGVLTAVGINAWWQGRQDVAQEQVYLRQLVADLRETVRVTEETDAYMAPIDRAGGRIWDAFYAPEPPPRDSLLAWRAVAADTRPVYPVLGTLEALVATGDLALVRDDSLRTAMTAYIQAARLQIDIQNRERQRWRDGLSRLGRRLTASEAIATTYPRGRLEAMFGGSTNFPLRGRDSARWRFALDVDTFLSDAEMENAAVEVTGANWNLRNSRGRMRDDALALLRRVEAHIEP